MGLLVMFGGQIVVTRKTPKWSALNALGTSKLVNSSFIWLALIPFLSRVLGAVQEWTHQCQSLPLSFVAFYFAAFSFSIAAGIFLWKCPTIAKIAPDFGVFNAKGHSETELKNWFLELAKSKKHPDAIDPEMILHFRRVVLLESGHGELDQADVFAEKARQRMMDAFWDIPLGSRLANAHDHVLRIADEYFPRWRGLAARFYVTGFALFSVVATYNLCSVGYSVWQTIKPTILRAVTCGA
ncbi:MAG TPA: hypothetical protein PLN52_04045 [Opitutaceae bacterium]|nr:hypothetical protein [Opitutaceae bacterium]